MQGLKQRQFAVFQVFWRYAIAPGGLPTSEAVNGCQLQPELFQGRWNVQLFHDWQTWDDIHGDISNNVLSCIKFKIVLNPALQLLPLICDDFACPGLKWSNLGGFRAYCLLLCWHSGGQFAGHLSWLSRVHPVY